MAIMRNKRGVPTDTSAGSTDTADTPDTADTSTTASTATTAPPADPAPEPETEPEVAAPMNGAIDPVLEPIYASLVSETGIRDLDPDATPVASGAAAPVAPQTAAAPGG